MRDVATVNVSEDSDSLKVSLPTENQFFENQLNKYAPILENQLRSVYSGYEDFDGFFHRLLNNLYTCFEQRPAEMKELDQKRLEEPLWFQSEKMIGGVCYVDLYAGNLNGIRKQIPYFQELGLTYLHLMPLFKMPYMENDGGYAVSSYREVSAELGTMQDLRLLTEDLRKAGISLVLDFIFNHTSNEHEWAVKAMQGDPYYKDFYYIYPDRDIPDQYERTVREIFPEEHAGAFTKLNDGRWVWTTFHSYQWDLNYSNPNVFLAMVNEMLFIANQGAEILRMDAVAFLWKKMGTVCENLPEVHTIIKAFNTVAKIVAPSLLFKSEAIVHPDDVVKYISVDECQLSYNPLQMALLWSTIATREVNLLHQALSERHHIDNNCAWVNYVRSHDDIGWTFSDEDATKFAITGYMHRDFLNRFYVDKFPGSFARGVPFQENLKTGDCRICGTTASLVGMEQGDPYAIHRILLLYSIVMSAGGIPLIYLGDEVGVTNNYDFTKDPMKRFDSRWVHRVKREENSYAVLSGNALLIRQQMLHLIELRKGIPAFAGGFLETLDSHNKSVLIYRRVAAGESIWVVANFSESPQIAHIQNTSLSNDIYIDVILSKKHQISDSIVLEPYQFMWLTQESH